MGDHGDQTEIWSDLTSILDCYISIQEGAASPGLLCKYYEDLRCGVASQPVKIARGVFSGPMGAQRNYEVEKRENRLSRICNYGKRSG